jgi:hypothetical protein
MTGSINQNLLEALILLYDKWENGDDARGNPGATCQFYL